MRSLIIQDEQQLHRVEAAIARIKGRSPGDQVRLTCLLAALESERADLLRYCRRMRRLADPSVAA